MRVVGLRAVGHELVAQLAREEPRLDLADHDVGARVGDRELRSATPLTQHVVDVGHEAAQPVGQPVASAGVSVTRADQSGRASASTPLRASSNVSTLSGQGRATAGS